MVKTPFYAVISNYQKELVISIHKSMVNAHKARHNFAKKYLLPGSKFTEIFKNYQASWLNYHRNEYPNYPLPSKQILLRQFLAEECYLTVDEISLTKKGFNGWSPRKIAKQYEQGSFSKDVVANSTTYLSK